MGREAHSTFFHIMYCVIVLENWKTKDMERLLASNNKEHALRKILIFTNIFDVHTWFHFYPLLIKHEVQFWEISVAFAYNIALNHFVIIASNVFKNSSNKVIKVKRTEVNYSRTCVEKSIKLIVFFLIIANTFIPINISLICRTYCNPLIVC